MNPSKLQRNLKVIRYRFSDIHTGELRKVDGRIVYSYEKIAKIANLDKAAVIRICQQREKWVDELKKLSKEYLK